MTTWTRATALEALAAFKETHGYQPITKEAGSHHHLPSWTVVVRLFGSWSEYVRAGGFTPYPARSSAQARTMAFRDRNPDWRERRFDGVKRSHVNA